MNSNVNDILLLIKNSEFNKSIEFLNVLIKEDNNNFDYYYLRGVSNLNCARNKAIEDFTSAINIKDNNFLAYHFRGMRQITELT